MNKQGQVQIWVWLIVILAIFLFFGGGLIFANLNNIPTPVWIGLIILFIIIITGGKK